MPKEMIVSVNGREKKIAIVENGRVTEFYIERGESSQGIVGNIYKGRVMRVLPGMQSAFVDIGLERDAFLYVSDFFDEEEEFERIVVDKKKSEGADDEAAQRAAAERIERSRVERERAAEQAQAEAEPGEDADEDEERYAAPEPGVTPTAIADVEGAYELAEEEPAAAEAGAQAAGPQGEGEEESAAAGRKRRRDRRRRGERGGDEPGVPASAAGEVPPGVSLPGGGAGGFGLEDVSTPFVAGADSFERVVDEEESAAEFGSTFKDARLQERLSDQTRAVEFDMEPTTAAQVGSLLGGAASGGGFERIADEDDAEEEPHARLHSVQPEVAATVASFVDEEDGAGAFTGGGAQSFERVSDDAEASGAPAASKKSSKKAASKGASSKKASKKGAAAGAEGGPEAEGGEASSKKGSKKSASKKSAAKGASKSAAKGASKRGSKKSAAEGGEEGGDAEASVTQRPPRGEFARRGGRRRRKPGGAPGSEQPENGDGHAPGAEAEADDNNGGAEVIVEAAAAAPAPAPAAAAQSPAPQAERAERAERPERRERGERGGRGRERDGGRGGERGRDGRGEASRGGGGREGAREGGRDGGAGREGGGAGREGGREGGGAGREGGREGGRGGERAPREAGRGRRDRQPTITDLLREGQEIIVQIAKEPIAAKGARITSHIALPGRFLVYMPTIEHVGVSRKIESDSERQRLR
ncbi:MAG TPA: hypothetical protein VF659_07740, partial [Pyrinomonadaceae bacterium]